MTASIGNSTCLKLFGLKKYFLDFVELYNNNYFPKVILISGNKGIGKFTLAFSLAPEFYRIIYKKNPRKFFRIDKITEKFNNLIDETVWEEQQKKVS